MVRLRVGQIRYNTNNTDEHNNKMNKILKQV